MTEPIDLLQERLEEIKQVRNAAKKNNLITMDLHKINTIYNRYYASIEILKRSTDATFVSKGILYKDVKDILVSQETEIHKLKRKVGKLRYDLAQERNPETIIKI